MRSTIAAALLALGLLVALLLAFGSNLPSPSSGAAAPDDGDRRRGRAGRRRRDPLLRSAAPGGASLRRGFRHGSHRIAIVIPYLAPSEAAPGLPPYFDAFAMAAAGSRNLVDFLIFHDGIASHLLPGEDELSPNVHLIDLGSTEEMAELFVRRVTDRRGDKMRLESNSLSKILAVMLRKYPYVLVEFKAAFGHIFEDYLKDYTHWGYADLDIVFGDLPRWVTTEELTKFDIVTFGFGDQDKLYLRGQFTFHKNNDKVNQLWRGCKFLSEMDERFAKVAEKQDTLHFESAEGCYSQVVLRQTDIKVKYAVKAFTDIKEDDTVYSHGLYIGTGRSGDRSVVYKAGSGDDDGKLLLNLPINWFESTESAYGDETKPLQWEVGPLEKVETHRDRYGDHHEVQCMYWAPAQYQLDLCALDVDSTYTVFLLDGVLYKQRHETALFPGNVVTHPLFHFQEWKRHYRSAQLAPLRHPSLSRGFVLSKNGAIPLLLPPTAAPATTALDARLTEWIDASRIDRDQLPSTTFCLRSSQKNHPTTASQCDDIVSWQDEDYVQIVRAGEAWGEINVKEDVTLALTLQITLDHVRQSDVLDRLLRTAESSVASWGQQPSVLLIHVSGATEEALERIENAFRPLPNGGKQGGESKGHFRSCVVAIISRPYDEAVSRKALINMASEAAPTRWVVSGMEVERGMVISTEASFFAKRAALIHRDIPGSVFVIPQFAATGDFFSESRNTRQGWINPIGIKSLIEARDTDNPGMTTKLWSFDCHPCSQQPKHTHVVKNIDQKLLSLWWDLTRSEVTGTPGTLSFSSATSLDSLATDINDFELSLIELLSEENSDAVRYSDQSPILMVDRIGPRTGMLTSDLALEVAEFAGLSCFNMFRLAQLATLGYRITTLPSAFAISLPSSRLDCRAGKQKQQVEAKSTTRCDGCILFEDDAVIQAILRDELERVAKTAVLQHELYSTS